MIDWLHFEQTANIGGAMVHRAADLIAESGVVAGFLHQYADAWDKGLRYGGRDESFWHHVALHHPRESVERSVVELVLGREGLR